MNYHNANYRRISANFYANSVKHCQTQMEENNGYLLLGTTSYTALVQSLSSSVTISQFRL